MHDGSKIVVTRSQSRGGRGEIGQSPIKEQAISFVLPGSSKSVTWKDEYSEDVGHSNFELLALHVLNGASYIVTSPYGSSAYKKWGSPNPPYALFKSNGATWQRITLAELPIQFKDMNFTINSSAHEKKLIEETRKSGYVSAVTIKEFNSSLTQEELKSVVRAPLEIWKPRLENLSSKAPSPVVTAPTVPSDKK